ncbi:hypothetical protein T484DRAFT_1821323 [Baffinella frigidus]|nr:hypothetical protein T484DRAFT_1821323 [Cryptophyta sp. CCMP2293]
MVASARQLALTLVAAMCLSAARAQENCSSAGAQACVTRYMHTYGCMAADVPLAPSDKCAPFISKAAGGECLAANCSCGCQRFFNTSEEANPAPSPEDTTLCETLKCTRPPVDMASSCAPGCGAGMVNNSVCDAACMNPWCAFDGGDCLTAHFGWPSLATSLATFDLDGGGLSHEEYVAYVDAAFANADNHDSLLSVEQAAYSSLTADGAVGYTTRQLSLLHGELAALLPAIALVKPAP